MVTDQWIKEWKTSLFCTGGWNEIEVIELFFYTPRLESIQHLLILPILNFKLFFQTRVYTILIL